MSGVCALCGRPLPARPWWAWLANLLAAPGRFCPPEQRAACSRAFYATLDADRARWDGPARG